MHEVKYKVEVAGVITPHRLYYFHQLQSILRDGNRVVEDVRGGLFRVEEYIFNNTTGQEMVLVRAVDGPRKGAALVCTPHDFCGCFRPAVVPAESPGQREGESSLQTPPPAAATGPRIAGKSEFGSGW